MTMCFTIVMYIMCSLQQDAKEGMVRAQFPAKVLSNLKTLPPVQEGCKEIAMVNVHIYYMYMHVQYVHVCVDIHVYTCIYFLNSILGSGSTTLCV